MASKKQILENNGVEFHPVNISSLKVVFPNINYEISKDEIFNKNVRSIVYNQELVEIGDKYTCTIANSNGTFDINYKVNSISVNPKDHREFYLNESRMNKTTKYILPFIFESRKYASIIDVVNGYYRGYLINAYVDCPFIESKDKNSIFLLLKFSKSELFKLQEDSFLTNKNFIRIVDIDHNYVLYEFTMPEIWTKDFCKLLNGEYSKISKASKKRIIDFHGEHIDGLICNKVLHKDPELVSYYEKELDVNMAGVELDSPFNEDEILTKDLL